MPAAEGSDNPFSAKDLARSARRVRDGNRRPLLGRTARARTGARVGLPLGKSRSTAGRRAARVEPVTALRSEYPARLLGSGFDPQVELAVLDPDRHPTAVAEAAEEELVGQRALEGGVDHPGERAGAEGGVVAAIGE
jgi:hypothetical protein